MNKPTPDEIRNEPAGPRLDGWISEFVFGKKVVVDDSDEHETRLYVLGEWHRPERPIDPIFQLNGYNVVDLDRVRAFSTERSAAWSVVEAMQAKGFSYGIWGVSNYSSVMPGVAALFQPSLYVLGFGEPNTTEGDDMPHAVCRAALLALLHHPAKAIDGY